MDQEKDKNVIDLSKGLEKSTPKSQSEQGSSESYVSPIIPKIVHWLIKHSGGLIKNEKQVSYVVLGFMVLMIIISIFLFSDGTVGEKQKIFTPPPETRGP